MKKGKENSICVCVRMDARRCKELEMISGSEGSEVNDSFKVLIYQRNERRSQTEGVTGKAFVCKYGRNLGMFIFLRQRVGASLEKMKILEVRPKVTKWKGPNEIAEVLGWRGQQLRKEGGSQYGEVCG